MICVSDVAQLKNGTTVYPTATLFDDESGSVTLGHGIEVNKLCFSSLEEGFAKLEVMKEYLAHLVFIKNGIVKPKG